jgi:hypothetical protein
MVGERSPAQRPSAVETCWLCGIRQRADLMVADGGSACDNVRWYCGDTRACTERWTRRSASANGDVGATTRHDAARAASFGGP